MQKYIQNNSELKCCCCFSIPGKSAPTGETMVPPQKELHRCVCHIISLGGRYMQGPLLTKHSPTFHTGLENGAGKLLHKQEKKRKEVMNCLVTEEQDLPLRFAVSLKGNLSSPRGAYVACWDTGVKIYSSGVIQSFLVIIQNTFI